MSSVLLFLIFAAWGAGITPLAIKLAQRYGVLDYPGARKIHHAPMPRGAGLVVWLGFLLWALLFAESSLNLKIAVSGATLVFFAGYLDDMLSMSPFGRLAAHFLAAVLSLFLVPGCGFVSMAVFLFWIAGVINAYNFIDGMNGLSLVMSFMTLTFTGIMSGISWAVPAAGIAAGVFPWNFPRAKTFLGDGGVYMLGYLAAVVTMLWLSSMQLGFFKLCLALLLIGGVPVIDTLCAITRRVLSGKSPFYPDRGHIHHRLLDRGLPPQKVLLILAVLHGISLFAAWLLLRQ
ncbi:MAG: MraY family glycosyltransferase [Pyramidobacter sp.]|nr:MraY family glycosyltransferase [Pyramidobacter sp.]